MFGIINIYFLTQKMKKLVKLSSAALYSEKYNIDTFITNTLSEHDNLDLVCLYVAIYFAAVITEPFKKKDLIRAVGEVSAYEKHLKDVRACENLLKSYKERAELQWRKKIAEIDENKIAYQTNEYSYQGMIYELERIEKGTLSSKEREKLNQLALDMALALAEEKALTSEIALEKAIEKKQTAEIQFEMEMEKARQQFLELLNKNKIDKK